jgi:hypothetical protein
MPFGLYSPDKPPKQLLESQLSQWPTSQGFRPTEYRKTKLEENRKSFELHFTPSVQLITTEYVGETVEDVNQWSRGLKLPFPLAKQALTEIMSCFQGTVTDAKVDEPFKRGPFTHYETIEKQLDNTFTDFCSRLYFDERGDLTCKKKETLAEDDQDASMILREPWNTKPFTFKVPGYPIRDLAGTNLAMSAQLFDHIAISGKYKTWTHEIDMGHSCEDCLEWVGQSLVPMLNPATGNTTVKVQGRAKACDGSEVGISRFDLIDVLIHSGNMIDKAEQDVKDEIRYGQRIPESLQTAANEKGTEHLREKFQCYQLLDWPSASASSNCHLYNLNDKFTKENVYDRAVWIHDKEIKTLDKAKSELVDTLKNDKLDQEDRDAAETETQYIDHKKDNLTSMSANLFNRLTDTMPDTVSLGRRSVLAGNMVTDMIDRFGQHSYPYDYVDHSARFKPKVSLKYLDCPKAEPLSSGWLNWHIDRQWSYGQDAPSNPDQASHVEVILDIKTTESADADDELFNSEEPRDRYIYALDPKDGPERGDMERNTYEEPNEESRSFVDDLIAGLFPDDAQNRTSVIIEDVTGQEDDGTIPDTSTPA